MAKTHHDPLRVPFPPGMRAHIPLGLSPVRLPRDLEEAFSAEALDVFSAVSNSGRGFVDALLAVYLSGLAAGIGGERERARKGTGDGNR